MVIFRTLFITTTLLCIALIGCQNEGRQINPNPAPETVTVIVSGTVREADTSGAVNSGSSESEESLIRDGSVTVTSGEIESGRVNTQTDSDGRYRLENVVVGENKIITIQFSSNNYTTYAHSQTIIEGQESVIIDVVLQKYQIAKQEIPADGIVEAKSANGASLASLQLEDEDGRSIAMRGVSVSMSVTDALSNGIGGYDSFSIAPTENQRQDVLLGPVAITQLSLDVPQNIRANSYLVTIINAPRSLWRSLNPKTGEVFKVGDKIPLWRETTPTQYVRQDANESTPEMDDALICYSGSSMDYAIRCKLNIRNASGNFIAAVEIPSTSKKIQIINNREPITNGTMKISTPAVLDGQLFYIVPSKKTSQRVSLVNGNYDNGNGVHIQAEEISWQRYATWRLVKITDNNYFVEAAYADSTKRLGLVNQNYNNGNRLQISDQISGWEPYSSWKVVEKNGILYIQAAQSPS